MTQLQTSVSAVREAATDGIAFDGLQVEPTEDGYHLVTAAGVDRHVDADALETALEDPDVATYVNNWQYWRDVGGVGTARRAFLRYCEHAPIDEDDLETEPTAEPLALEERYDRLTDGIDRHWGQLAITVHLEDGRRRYVLRHEDDANADRAALTHYEDPREARELATTDSDGRYRPLKTAPSLDTGWLFADLGGDQLVEAVRYLYPATIANWHRELRGNLDVDHWRDTAERQTGIYDVIEELPREAVEWMTEACCVDSECLRRREWQYDEDDELDIDGGDGPFPCREPCSLVVAAARKWTTLESESEKTYELELTTSEFNQLSELIDAVADDEIDEIREADVYKGANRYRARYLRAKRFDDEGSLAARVQKADESEETGGSFLSRWF